MNKKVASVLSSWDFFLGILFICTFAYACVSVPHFSDSFNLSQASAEMTEKALMLLPMVMLIIVREIDLSIASILAFCSVILGLLVRASVPLFLAIPVVLLAGSGAGAINGYVVCQLGLPSLIVTLGTMAFFRGLGYILLGTGAINELSDSLTNFGLNTIGSTAIPWITIPFIISAVIFTVVLQCTPLGRKIYATGGNPAVALYSGIRVNRIRFGLFVASGLMSSIASIILTARLSNARANNAFGYELDVITIAFLGGTSVFGGKGNYIGVFFALGLVAMIRNVLGLRGMGGDNQGIAVGLLLILSLLLTNTIQRFVDRARTRRSLKGVDEVKLEPRKA
jgi:rhamnose transport system permease protein